MNSVSPHVPDAENVSPRDDHGGIQVIARAATILRALADSPAGLGLGPLSRLVSLPRSTVQRIVAALELERFVESGGPEGVRLGIGLSALAVNVQSNVVEILRPLMEALSRHLGETVVLGRVRRRDIVIVDQVIAERELSFRARLNAAFPLSCTAGGKALLAGMTDEAVAHLLGPELPRLTATSPPDLPSLLADLVEIRRKGMAYDHETNGVGLCAVAVSIPPQDVRDWPHAVSVVVPTARFRELDVLQTEKALLAFRTAAIAELEEDEQRTEAWRTV